MAARRCSPPESVSGERSSSAPMPSAIGRRPDAILDRGRRQSQVFQPEGKFVANGRAEELRLGVLEHQPRQMEQGGGPVGAGVPAADRDAPVESAAEDVRDQPVREVGEGAFPRTVGAEDDGIRPGSEAEVEIPQRRVPVGVGIAHLLELEVGCHRFTLRRNCKTARPTRAPPTELTPKATIRVPAAMDLSSSTGPDQPGRGERPQNARAQDLAGRGGQRPAEGPVGQPGQQRPEHAAGEGEERPQPEHVARQRGHERHQHRRRRPQHRGRHDVDHVLRRVALGDPDRDEKRRKRHGQRHQHGRARDVPGLSHHPPTKKPPPGGDGFELAAERSLRWHDPGQVQRV